MHTGSSARIQRPSAAWPPICWVISDGKAGTENQSVGLAEAMGLNPVVKRLRVPRLWRELGLHFGVNMEWTLRHNDIEPPWPDLLIGTGRTSVLASLLIKKASGGRTFTVQIQTPIVAIDRFDCVIVPTHDEIHGDNVIPMQGALHRVTPELLRDEVAKWAPHFAHLPRPYVAVLLGGHNAAVSPLRRLSSYRLGTRKIVEIGGMLRDIARNGPVSLLITASRRTNAAAMAQLKAALKDCPVAIWDGKGENPYYGMLGLADSFIVTCDSVNMICEACSTGKPVHMIELPGYSRKIAAFQRSFLASGRIRTFNGMLEYWQYEPLREKERVAALVRQAYITRKS
jgi:mitochondrial fission protein ELM1